VARTFARPAERETAALAQQETVRVEVLCYVNRLSDGLLVLARVAARTQGHEGVLWHHQRRCVSLIISSISRKPLHSLKPAG